LKKGFSVTPVFLQTGVFERVRSASLNH